MSQHKFGERHFTMLSELNKYGFQCSASSH